VKEGWSEWSGGGGKKDAGGMRLEIHYMCMFEYSIMKLSTMRPHHIINAQYLKR
jgi:hypothetical protein